MGSPIILRRGGLPTRASTLQAGPRVSAWMRVCGVSGGELALGQALPRFMVWQYLDIFPLRHSCIVLAMRLAPHIVQLMPRSFIPEKPAPYLIRRHVRRHLHHALSYRRTRQLLSPNPPNEGVWEAC